MIQQCYEDIQKPTKSIPLLMNRAGGVDNPTRNNVFYDFAQGYGDIKMLRKPTRRQSLDSCYFII